MSKNLIFFCNTCGEMKKITYNYMTYCENKVNKESNDLQINCTCLNENKKRSYPIEIFLNNTYKSNPKIICNLHSLSFTYWCNNCNINICDQCLVNHKNHKLIQLSSLLINKNDIIILHNKIGQFQTKLLEKKKKIDEKKVFNEKEENEFLKNFEKYYKLNLYQISFVKKVKDFYLSLLNNKMICYQIIINLKYLIEKLNKLDINNLFKDDNIDINKVEDNNEIKEIVDMYFIVFNTFQYCLLPNNEEEEREQKAEEMRNTLKLERSSFISKDDLLDNNNNNNSGLITLDDIPLSETIKVNQDLILRNNINPSNDNQNKIYNYNKNNNNINSNEPKLLINLTNGEGNIKNKNLDKPKFYGLFKNGKYHGDKCKMIYPNGFIYEGSFREGLRHGEGILYHKPSNYQYKGGWENDKKNGKCIEIINGDIFDGYYKNGIREGKCTITYRNKDKFIGTLKEGKKDGYGEIFFKTNTTYKGGFKNNLYEGKGEIISKSGYYYKGEFLEGLRHGDNCTEIKKDFKKYVGSFRRDKMNGKGIFEWYSGDNKDDIYNGEFKDDLFEGFGTYKYCNGTIYKGEFFHGMKHGKGKEIYIDGSIYEGDYIEGQKNGKGIFQDIEGNIYEGNFYRGNKHSKGKLKFVNGEILEGFWLNGIKEGIFHFIDANGKKYIRKYAKDELIEEKKEGFLTSFFTGISEMFDKISLIKNRETI